MIRSILLASADDADALKRAFGGPADAVAIMLSGLSRARRNPVLDSVLAGPREAAGRPLAMVIVNSLGSPATQADLADLCPAGPFALLLRRAESAADIQHLGAILAVEEARAGFEENAFRIVALAETGSALFGLNAFKGASPRLDAVGWDGEALAADLGSDVARGETGGWTDPLQTARTLTLAAAADAGLAAIDSVFSGAGPEAFRLEAEAARRDGFRAKFALDAEQVAIVNAVFATA